MTALVKKPWEFYTMRFLLGLGEAGFYPGVIVYLTHWFPKSDRTKALAWFFYWNADCADYRAHYFKSAHRNW